MPKDKEKENLKSTKRELVIYKGASMWLSVDFSTEKFQTRRDWHEIFSDKEQVLTPQTPLPSKAIISNWRRNTELPRQEKDKGVYYYQINITRNIKRSNLKRKKIRGTLLKRIKWK